MESVQGLDGPIKVAEVGLGQHLLAAEDAGFLPLPFIPVVAFRVELCGEGVAELQHGLELVAVKIALAGLPVNELVHVQAHHGIQHIGLGVKLAEDRTALRHLGQRLPQVRQGPAHAVAHDLGGARHGADGEIAEDLIELAVLLVGLQGADHQLVAAQVRVLVDEGPQVLQDALGAVLPQGQAAGVQDIRHVARQDLRVQLLEGGLAAAVNVELGVVLDLDAVGLAFLVEVDDRLPGVIGKIQAGVDQRGLLRQLGPGGGGQEGHTDGDVLVLVVILLEDGRHPSVGQEEEAADGVAADVRLDPGEEALPRSAALLGLVGLEAEDRVVHLVVEQVVPAAGVDVVGVVGHDILLAPRLLLRIDGQELVAAGLGRLVVIPLLHPHQAAGEGDQVVPHILPIQLKTDLHLIVQGVDFGLGAHIEVPGGVEGLHVQVLVLADDALHLLLELGHVDALQLVAVLVQLPPEDGLAGFFLRRLVRGHVHIARVFVGGALVFGLRLRGIRRGTGDRLDHDVRRPDDRRLINRRIIHGGISPDVKHLCHP